MNHGAGSAARARKWMRSRPLGRPKPAHPERTQKGGWFSSKAAAKTSSWVDGAAASLHAVETERSSQPYQGCPLNTVTANVPRGQRHGMAQRSGNPPLRPPWPCFTRAHTQAARGGLHTALALALGLHLGQAPCTRSSLLPQPAPAAWPTLGWLGSGRGAWRVLASCSLEAGRHGCRRRPWLAGPRPSGVLVLAWCIQHASTRRPQRRRLGSSRQERVSEAHKSPWAGRCRGWGRSAQTWRAPPPRCRGDAIERGKRSGWASGGDGRWRRAGAAPSAPPPRASAGTWSSDASPGVQGQVADQDGAALAAAVLTVPAAVPTVAAAAARPRAAPGAHGGARAALFAGGRARQRLPGC